MPTPAPAVQISYLTVQEAAARLDLSKRRILDFVHTGAIKSVKQRDPASGQMATRLDAGDVERFKDERDRPRPAAIQHNELAPQRPAKPLQIAAPQTIAQPPLSRAWLTLEESEAYTGLPASELHGMIKLGTLLALDVGVRAGGRYRVKRQDLDAIEGMRYGAGVGPIQGT